MQAAVFTGANRPLELETLEVEEPRAGEVRVRMLASGIWQKRDFARSVGDGVYELDINVPQTGLYFVFVESRSQGVSFRQLPHLTLQTEASRGTNNATKDGTK